MERNIIVIQQVNQSITKSTKYLNVDRWLFLMESLGFGQNIDTFEALDESYAEKHRKYHTAEHINATLEHFEMVKHQCEKPQLLELALWFHDVIYQPFSSSNEADSAQWAKQFLHNNKAGLDAENFVVELIMATLHTAEPENKDQALLVDIDLSILGSKEEVYQQFAKDIRFEYKRVPYFLYKKKRKEVLVSFLNRDAIYKTPYYRAELESQARVNMKSELGLL